MNMNAQLRSSITKINNIREEMQATRTRQLERARMLEERKRAAQGRGNIHNRMDEDVSLDM